MKLRELVAEDKVKYLDQLTKTATNYENIFKQINPKLLQYSDIHYKMTKNIVTVTYAKEQKEALKVEIKNINGAGIDQVMTDLQGLKELYLKEFAPKKEPTTDTLELSFIEKELSVMNDKELNDYYNENYLDANILRLCKIEYKKRDKPMMGKPEFSDSILNAIDNEIKSAIALRQIVTSMIAYSITMGEDIKKVMYSWDPIFHQLEVRSSNGPQRFDIKEFMK